MGQAMALGLDPHRMLVADPVETSLLVEAVHHAAEYNDKRDEALARRIINELSRAWKG
jgi:hypothetical protein